METIRGKTSLHLNFKEIRNQLKNYSRTVLDLGTGDGRYVHHLANNHPDWFVIGVDACRENLRDRSRAKVANALFIIAPAQELSGEFDCFFSHVAINFPWGSLLDGLLAGDPGLMHGLASVSRPGAKIEMYLNSGALKEAGTDLERGAGNIYKNLARYGWDVRCPQVMDGASLAKFPTTWARRLAHGRDPFATRLSGRRA
jgi:16S rRNA (adenine(1408)-N(1))-methyltransferase